MFVSLPSVGGGLGFPLRVVCPRGRRRSVRCLRRPGLGLRLGLPVPVAPAPVPPAPVAPAPSRVLWSGFRAGGLASVALRSSSRAFSGAVVVCSFRSPVVAGRFAGRWAGRLGVSVFVRPAAGLWSVSVPVAAAVAPAVPLVLPVAGGVRGCAAVAVALAAASAPVPPVPPAPGGGWSFGFCGPRSLSSAWAPVVALVARSLPASASAALGCAAGADALVRAALPSACVWSVASGGFGGGRRAFARRSAALVRSLPLGGWFVGFVSAACPAGVVPSRSWSSGASVSGSWSSLALAAGRGLSVGVVWCSLSAPVLPAWPGGAWSPVSVAPWSGAALPAALWLWSPVVAPSLFAGFASVAGGDAPDGAAPTRGALAGAGFAVGALSPLAQL